jgi:hypothetical protein
VQSRFSTIPLSGYPHHGCKREIRRDATETFAVKQAGCCDSRTYRIPSGSNPCGKRIGRAIEELTKIVTLGTFYRWLRDEKKGKPKTTKAKGGQREQLREISHDAHDDVTDASKRMPPARHFIASTKSLSN